MRSGIFTGDGGLFHAGQALIANRWQSPVDGQDVQVYAGTAADNPAQGILFVVVTTPGNAKIQIQAYPAPAGVGPLEITGVNRLVLQLQAHNGLALHFDLPTRQFSR